MQKNWDVEVGQIRKVVNKFIANGFHLPSNDAEDLVQEIFCHFWDKKLFERYDPSITSYAYFLYAATKNYLITLSKREKLHYVSLDRIVSPEDGDDDTSFMDFLASKCCTENEVEATVIADQIRATLPQTSISKVYKLSFQNLFDMVYIMRMKTTEIAKDVGITVGRVSQLTKELEKRLRRARLQLGLEVLTA